MLLEARLFCRYFVCLSFVRPYVCLWGQSVWYYDNVDVGGDDDEDVDDDNAYFEDFDDDCDILIVR